VQIGLLFSLTLVGDLVVSLLLTSVGDSVGRKRIMASGEAGPRIIRAGQLQARLMMVRFAAAGAVLHASAGLIFASYSNYYLLLLASVIGVISPAGGEIGPFAPCEQAAVRASLVFDDLLPLLCS
jgi:hypothetical protein